MVSSVMLASLGEGFRKAQKRKKEDDYIEKRRERQEKVEARDDEAYGLDQADKAHTRERRGVLEKRQDEEYERQLREGMALAEKEGFGAALPFIEDGNLAEAERQFNMRGQDRIAPGSLTYDKKTGQVSGKDAQTGQVISMSIQALRVLVHGPAKKEGSAKLGPGDRLVGEDSGRIIAENPKPKDDAGGGAGGFGFGGKGFDDLQNTYKAVEQHLAQRFGGRYDSQTQQIIGIPPENSEVWSEATSVAQDLIGAAAQGGITAEVLPYATVADVTKRAAAEFRSMPEATKEAEKLATSQKVPPEQRQAFIDKTAREIHERSRGRWRQKAVELVKGVLAQRGTKGGGAPAADPAAGGAAPAAAVAPAGGPAPGASAATPQGGIPPDIVQKAKAKIASDPRFAAGVKKRLQDMGYTPAAIKDAGL